VCAATGVVGEKTCRVPIGRPIGNAQVYVLDAARALVPNGVTGELYIGGAGVARGYLRRPSLTAERFVPDPHGDVPGARLFRTGDLGCYDANGQLHYMGRCDAQSNTPSASGEPTCP
jgi:non-ribosomal peptide synthetase component F